MSFGNDFSQMADPKTDVVADRHSLVLIGLTAVWLGCLIFTVIRLVVTLRTGMLTPWWGNAGGFVAVTALYAWYRRGPQARSSVAAHGTALVATLGLLIPIAYGMTSTIWWLSLVGFAMVLLGRRQEAKVWGMAIPLLVAASVIAEPYVQVEGAAGEPFVEAAASKIVFVLILMGMALGFRRVAEQRALALHNSEVGLRESEERSRAIVQTCLDGFWINDSNGRFVDVNDSYCKMVGYSREELLTMGIPDIEASEDSAETARHLKRVFMQGYDRFETRHRRKNGDLLDIEVSARSRPAGQIVVFLRDITERKRSEEALRESEQRLAQETTAVAEVVSEMLSGRLSDAETERQVLNACLDSTNSVYGTIGTINDHGTYNVSAYSSRTPGDRTFPEAIAWEMSTGMENRGIRGWPMIHGEPLLCNNLQDHPSRAGHPKGHVRIECFLGVPVIHDGKVTGIVAVANKPGGYVDADKKTLMRLVDVMAVSRRHRELLAELEQRVRDMTKAETALRESEQRLREAQRLGRIGYWALDTQTHEIHWSDTLYTIFGRDPRLGPPTAAEEAEYYPIEDAQRLRGCIEKTLETGEPYQVDVSLQRTDGTVVNVIAIGSAVKDPYGRIVRLLGTIQDITDRYRSEKALRESEERFRRVFNKVHDGILVSDQATKRFTLANESICRMLGHTEEELLRLGVADIHPEEDMARVLAAFEKQVRAETPVVSLPVKRKDGTVFRADVTATPITLEGRDCLVGCFRDVTERDKLHASLAQSDRLASMGMLAAGVAHEINNPLTYVLLNIQSLSEELPQLADLTKRFHAAPGEKAGPSGVDASLGDARHGFDPALFNDAVERLQEVFSGTQRIKSIVRSLGTFSRVEGTAVAPINIQTCIEHAATMAFNELKFRAKIVKDFSQVPEVLASDGKLAQVFLNLLINAAQAIAEGHVEQNEVRIRTWSEGTSVFAEVSDTGKGIAPEIRHRIFEPFFTTKGVGVGTGLGLGICKKIIEEFGGDISFTSEVGKGTKFLVRLPRMPSGWEQRGREGRDQTIVPCAARGRILVVDDEAEIRSAIVRILKSDHEVVTVRSGAEGRDLLEKDKGFDLIFCDLMMPEMSGMELHAWLSEHDPRLAGQIVFITGGAFTPGASEYLNKVENKHVEKPIDVVAFKKMTNEMMLTAQRKRGG